MVPGIAIPAPSRRVTVSSSRPAMLARCFFIGLPTNNESSLVVETFVSIGAVVIPGRSGGVADKSLLTFGVEAADGVFDFEFLRASVPSILFRGSAECWRLSCPVVS
jgi:hypothetical protein